MARGGYRPGAGRPKGKRGKTAKPSLKVPPAVGAAATEAGLTPMGYLLTIMRDPDQDPALRARAAALLLPFLHQKTGEAGKKAQAAADAVNAAVDTEWDEILPRIRAQ